MSGILVNHTSVFEKMIWKDHRYFDWKSFSEVFDEFQRATNTSFAVYSSKLYKGDEETRKLVKYRCVQFICTFGTKIRRTGEGKINRK